MKVKVIKKFKNKYSKGIHNIGDILDISDKRFEEINSTSYGILVEEIKEDKETKKTKETKSTKKK